METMRGIPDEATKRFPYDYAREGDRFTAQQAFIEGAEWARNEAFREAAEVAARAWREGAVAILRSNGIESVDRYLENLAENGHANPYLAEGGAQ